MAKHSNPPSKSATKSLSRWSILGPPPLLDGEDAAAFDELLARVSAGVKPVDMIEEVWVRDIVDLTWEILRWRRLKIILVALAMPAAVERTLVSLIPEPPSDPTTTGAFPSLILDFTPGPPSPIHKLAEKWAVRDPAAIDRVNKLLSSANVTMETVMAKAFMNKIDDIERIDRLATIAEGRRNSVLREIDRRRAPFGHALREKVRNVEEAEFKVVESKRVTLKDERGKDAA